MHCPTPSTHRPTAHWAATATATSTADMAPIKLKNKSTEIERTNDEHTSAGQSVAFPYFFLQFQLDVFPSASLHMDTHVCVCVCVCSGEQNNPRKPKKGCTHTHAAHAACSMQSGQSGEPIPVMGVFCAVPGMAKKKNMLKKCQQKKANKKKLKNKRPNIIKMQLQVQRCCCCRCNCNCCCCCGKVQRS